MRCPRFAFALLCLAALSSAVAKETVERSAFKRFQIAGTPAPVYYYASHRIEDGSRCETAAVIIHGWGGGVELTRDVEPFARALAEAVGPSNTAPYVVSPLFPRRRILVQKGVKDDGLAVWNDSWGRDLSVHGAPDDDWRGGGDAAGLRLSSFEVVDSILLALGDKNRYPALKRVLVTGFSAGGQFVGRYVAAGKGFVREGVEVRYAAMAPSTDLRLDDDVIWHYGLKGRPRYSAQMTREQIQKNLSSRRVWRACGTKDVLDKSLDVCPEAMKQGANRYARFRSFETYLKQFPAWAKQVSFHAIEGIGHESIVAHTERAFIDYALGRTAAAEALPPGGWVPAVRERINALIERNRGNPDAYAVFDFDYTTAIGDLSYACMWRLMETFDFKTDDFGKLFAEGLPSGYEEEAGTVCALAAKLKPFAGSDLTERPEWREFVVRYWKLYRRLFADVGDYRAYLWRSRMFAGHTPDELRVLATDAVRQNLAKGRLYRPSYMPKEKRGLTIPQEMKDLFRALKQAGIAVYIVSGSFQETLLAATGPDFGLDIDPSCVFGANFRKDAAGRYLPEMVEGCVKSGEKPAFIRAHIAPRHHGAEPVLTAGDSMGDYTMLTEFRNLQLALVFMRNWREKKMYELVASGGRVVAQGRDESRGVFIPEPKCIEPVALAGTRTWKVRPMDFADGVSRRDATLFDELMPRPVKVEAAATGETSVVPVAALGNVAVIRGQVPGAPAATADEAYILEIGSDGAKITASGPFGEIWARVTLDQLVRLSQDGRVPCGRIVDWPRLKWRGFMLDSVRNYLPPQGVKDIIDVMSRYKLNLFHWHLTENYAWRLESKRFPELQSERAFLHRHKGKFYTQEEFREIVDYAYARGVRVMPEFDFPGHALAFRRAFGFKTMSDPGVAEKAAALFEELCTLAPKERMPFVHMGTDEVFKREVEGAPRETLERMAKAIADGGRTMVSWVPGETYDSPGPRINMLWTDKVSPDKNPGAYFDAIGMYIEDFDPFELFSVAVYHKAARWHDAGDLNQGAIFCAWHDGFVGLPYENLLRNQPVFPSCVLFGDAYWHGRDNDLPQFRKCLPRGGDPLLAEAVDLERRTVAQRDRALRDLKHPFHFLRQTGMRWRLTQADGTLIATDIAQATISPGRLKGADGQYLLSPSNGTVVAETWIKSPRDQSVGAWIGFTGISRDHGLVYSAPLPDMGEWNRFGAKAELNGEPIEPPRWKRPGLKKGKAIADWTPAWTLYEADEEPFTDQEYFMREPTPIRLRRGWNHVRLTIPNPAEGGKTRHRWTGTFIPVEGATDHPREVQGLEYASVPPAVAGAVEVKVDFSKEVGPVKPMHAVGQPPILGVRSFKLFHHLKEAGVPYSRLHDVGVYRPHMVDIPNIFRNFDADENDPASYDFYYTDRLLEALLANNVEPWFRLGVSIENHCKEKAYNIYPPKDYAKWARICEHVIRHYTEGWANGFKWKITYWEIWNEPDNRKDPIENQQWRGEFPQFCELYAVASRHLKAKFPHLKIGGYGSCGYRLLSTPPEKRDKDMYHRVQCLYDFLTFAKKEKLPLDFFSYHSYLAPSDTVSHVALARKALDDAGYTRTELSLNEWLPVPSREVLGTATQAADVCAEMLGLQGTSLDSAMIYDARCNIGTFSPLFNPFDYKPHKAYYAFKAFNELYKRKTEVLSSSSDPWRTWVVAARGEKDGAVVIAHTGDDEMPLVLDMNGRAGARPSPCGDIVHECRITDETRTNEIIPLPTTLPPHSILVMIVALCEAHSP